MRVWQYKDVDGVFNDGKINRLEWVRWMDGCKAMLILVRKLKDSWLIMTGKDYIQRITQRPLHDKTKFYSGISSCGSLNQYSTVLCAATLEAYNPEDKVKLLRNLKGAHVQPETESNEELL